MGVVLFAPEGDFLAARVSLADVARRFDLASADFSVLEQRLTMFVAVAQGYASGGAMATMPMSERFHWLVAPRSTVIQTSPVHVGWTSDPAGEVGRLMKRFVLRLDSPNPEPPSAGGADAG